MKPLSIVFAGTPGFGLPALNAIFNSPHHISAIYTQPDKPKGRGQQLIYSDIKSWALAHDIPVMQPVNFKSQDDVDALAALKPDVMVVIAYGLILPKSVLSIPKFGCINVHASLLPKFRGAAPIQHAILSGDPETGVTIMNMDVGMDTGDMLKKASCPVLSNDTTGSLHDKLASLAVMPLIETLNQIAEKGILQGEPQSNADACYASKILKEDAKIDWHADPALTLRRIRAYQPWPVAFTKIGEDIWRIHEASWIPEASSGKIGEIIAISAAGIDVKVSEGCIRLLTIQLPNKRAMQVRDWFNGRGNFPDKGDVFYG